MTHHRSPPAILPGELSTMIELHALQFAHDGAAPLFGGLSLRIAPGEKVVLLGANGCGKSTLLKLMNGLLFPSQGECRWEGTALSAALLARGPFARAFRCANVLLFQHPEAMLFNPTVADEVAYGPRRLGLADAEARVERWSAALGLTPLLARAPFGLSGGEKQKVALASLLVLEPQLLLLDEPGASLDPATIGWLIDTLIDSPQTVVVSTHNLSLAAELGTRGIVLGAGGQLLRDAPLPEILADLELLERARLAHRHRQRQGATGQGSLHVHDWDASAA